METITMTTLLETITSIVTAAFEWASSAIKFVTSNPLTLIFAVIPLVGLGVGLFKRLLGN